MRTAVEDSAVWASSAPSMSTPRALSRRGSRDGIDCSRSSSAPRSSAATSSPSAKLQAGQHTQLPLARRQQPPAHRRPLWPCALRRLVSANPHGRRRVPCCLP